MDLGLEGRVALVLGGSRGLGEASADTRPPDHASAPPIAPSRRKSRRVGRLMSTSGAASADARPAVYGMRARAALVLHA